MLRLFALCVMLVGMSISFQLFGQTRSRCELHVENRRYCYDGKDTTIWYQYSAALRCPDEALESNLLPLIDTINKYTTVHYRRLDVRVASPSAITEQIFLMFEMQKVKNPQMYEGEKMFIPLFWDNYFDNAHNLSGRAFIAQSPVDTAYKVAIHFGLIGMYDVVTKEKVIGSPWSDKNPGGTIYYDEEGREILRLIYGN